MKDRRAVALACLAALLLACTGPATPAPGLPERTQAPPEPNRAPAEASPALLVEQLIAEAQQQPASGGRLAALALLQEARTHAAGNPELLAAVSRATLDRDWQVGLAVAREAAAADESSPAALVALGAALYRNRLFGESRAPLERAYEVTAHGLQPGLHLALTLEALQEFERARQVLEDLDRRFPGAPEVAHALQRLDSLVATWPIPGTPGTDLADWKSDLWWIADGLLIGVRTDEKTLEAIDPDGTVRWNLTCGATINDLVVDPTGGRALVFTAEQGWMIDLTSGALLGVGPGAGPSLWLSGFDWRDDLIAIGATVPPPAGGQGMAAAAYFGTTWEIYRIVPETGGTVRFDLLYRAGDGSRKAALGQGGELLLSWFGNHGAGRPRLFRNGAMVTEYPGLPVGSEFALDPRDDRFYFVGYEGSLQARTLGGELLWQAPADRYARPIVWADEAGAVQIAVWHQANVTVYADQGAARWGARGTPLRATARHLVVSQEGEVHLLDREGALVARYPSGTYLTRDGKAMVNHEGERIHLYRLPGSGGSPGG